jgi:hypothetical protein
MVFSSLPFVCVFLPVVVGLYFALPKAANNFILVVAILRDVGRVMQSQGVITNYSIAVWTDSLDMNLATPDTSEAAIVAYQICSEHKYRYAISGSFASIWMMVIKSRNVKWSAKGAQSKSRSAECALPADRCCGLRRSEGVANALQWGA